MGTTSQRGQDSKLVFGISFLRWESVLRRAAVRWKRGGAWRAEKSHDFFQPGRELEPRMGDGGGLGRARNERGSRKTWEGVACFLCSGFGFLRRSTNIASSTAIVTVIVVSDVLC